METTRNNSYKYVKCKLTVNGTNKMSRYYMLRVFVQIVHSYKIQPVFVYHYIEMPTEHMMPKFTTQKNNPINGLNLLDPTINCNFEFEQTWKRNINETNGR